MKEVGIARICLSKSEEKKLQKDLKSIFQWLKQLEKIKRADKQATKTIKPREDRATQPTYIFPFQEAYIRTKKGL